MNMFELHGTGNCIDAMCMVPTGFTAITTRPQRSSLAAAATPRVDVEETSRQQAAAALPFQQQKDQEVSCQANQDYLSSFTLLGLRHGSWVSHRKKVADVCLACGLECTGNVSDMCPTMGTKLFTWDD